MDPNALRPEEARVFDRCAGYHPFHDEEGETYGSFEVFWHDAKDTEEGDVWHDEYGDIWADSGWYWWACFPGCLPDGEPAGPFARSDLAFYDADEYHPDND